MADFEFKDIGCGYEVVCYNGKGGDVRVPSSYNGRSVTSIGTFSFDCRNGINKIVLPNTIKRIEHLAFHRCEMKTIVLPDSIAYIDYNAFEDSRLESVALPSSLTSIEPKTFFYCTNLTSVTIPSSVKRIDDDAFANCTALESIRIPSSVNYIGTSAFERCNNLKKVYFDNPKGWYLTLGPEYTSGNDYSSEDMEHPPTAAKIMTKIYPHYKCWKRR